MHVRHVVVLILKLNLNLSCGHLIIFFFTALNFAEWALFLPSNLSANCNDATPTMSRFDTHVMLLKIL